MQCILRKTKSLPRFNDRLPPLYRTKEVEKKVFEEWKKLVGLSELNSKIRYVQLSRTLKTYGMTVFKIQIKGEEKKKKKLIDAVICLNKEGVSVIEYETKVSVITCSC